MEPIVSKRYYKNWEEIRPGPVGPVGDVLMAVKLKHSAPDLPIRMDKTFSGKNEKRLGANITDGDYGDPSARVLDSDLVNNTSFKCANGWRYQDLRVPDRRYETQTGETPRYSWYNKIATAYEARRTGEMFLPLPGEYRLADGDVPRGGQTPRIIEGELSLLDEYSLIDPVLGSIINRTNPQNGYRRIPGLPQRNDQPVIGAPRRNNNPPNTNLQPDQRPPSNQPDQSNARPRYPGQPTPPPDRPIPFTPSPYTPPRFNSPPFPPRRELPRGFRPPFIPPHQRM